MIFGVDLVTRNLWVWTRRLLLVGVLLGDVQLAVAEFWTETHKFAAPEANQAAATDEQFVYAITNTKIARYDRESGRRLAESTGAAQHLNSGFFADGKLYCAHSNFPQTPERSEIKLLNLETMQLSTFHDFGNFGGSLTWAVIHHGHWWCNFARYGDDNAQTFLVELDAEWKELRRWTYPSELIRKLGRNSLSGGIWSGVELLVTGHDDPVVFRLRLPVKGSELEFIGTDTVPFTGQGFAVDLKTGGLIGINRAKKQIVFASQTTATSLVPELRHLRSGPVREWSEFPEEAQAASLNVTFKARKNAAEASLFMRQQDVKQSWQVRLNGQQLGEMTRDENDMLIGFPISVGRLQDGENHLQIMARSMDAVQSDDIRVGAIRLEQRPLRETLTEAELDIEVRDTTTKQPLPCRVTLVNSDGALPMLGTSSSASIATRPGLAYLANGHGRIQLPAGHYTVYAGRGFEYSLAQQEVNLVAGQAASLSLMIQREVPTDGYVACDTHIHTLTHSGHGDATVEERMLTIAGEGIELPVATDHNRHIDIDAIARGLHVRQHFTPVIGSEVTTGRGHFNIFPVLADGMPPDHRLGSWREIFAEIVHQADPPVIILNHAQDLHSGVRPFGPKLFNAVVAEHREEWPERLNAMEVINSGATQTDPMQLIHNWMALLNRGRRITPIGSSDSHDVGRHFVGQSRTYIRCDDRVPDQVSVAEAVDALQHGRVMVSYGLLTEMVVNNQYRSGDVASIGDQPCRVAIRVLGPHWVQARQVQLFANGQLIREAEIPAGSRVGQPAGVLWSDVWEIPRPQHDVHLVAVAIGPGIDQAYWRTAKPYQPVSLDGKTHVLGCSGAVWLDIDGDGQPTSAREYAERLASPNRDDLPSLLKALATYDTAVAAHVAFLHHERGKSPVDAEVQRAWRAASPASQKGFQNYVEAWKQCEIARQSSSSSKP